MFKFSLCIHRSKLQVIRKYGVDGLHSYTSDLRPLNQTISSDSEAEEENTEQATRVENNKNCSELFFGKENGESTGSRNQGRSAENGSQNDRHSFDEIKEATPGLENTENTSAKLVFILFYINNKL